MKTKPRLFLAIIFVGLMVVAGYIQSEYDNRDNYFKKERTFVTLPSGKTLRILSFGYRNLAADMLFIWSIQFYSNYRLTNSYDYLERVYNTITDITPKYEEPYIVGSWIMALEAKNPKMAIRILQKGAANMPDEWLFDSECGYYAKKYLKDYKLAEQYFLKAASNKSAPSYLKRQRAHMVYMEDDLQSAYDLWIDIYKNAKEGLERTSAANHLHQIKFEMDKKWLNARINVFKQYYNRFPRSLEELKRTRLIDEVPRDFDGNDYVYDPQTGAVTAQKVFRWKKSL
jgi:hypothetical protein